MTRISRWCSASVLFVLVSASPVLAQEAIDRLLGMPINAIELRVEGRPETSQPLLALIDIKPGDKLSVEAYRRVAQRFDEVPRFERVSVLVEEGPGGFVLVFDAKPKHPVNAILVLPTGTTGLAPGDLEGRIREEFSGIPALTRTGEVEETVRRILKEEGFRSADATANVREEHNPDRSTLEISVNAGARTTIVNAVIRGKSPLDPAKTLARLGATPGSPYRERMLSAALAEIRDELRAKNYYTAIAQASDPEYTPDGTGVSLVITIDAGPIVVVNVDGELPGRQDDYIEIKRANSVETDVLENSVRFIVDGWKRKGYWKARASYKTETPSPDLLIVTFTVERGQQYRVLRLALESPVIGPADLELLEPLHPGAVFDQASVAAALGAIKRLYQIRGYYQVILKPEYEEVVAQGKGGPTIIIHPNIVEGPQAHVTRIAFDLGDRPKITETELKQILASKEGQLFSLENLDKDRKNLPVFYESRGFLERSVVIDAKDNAQGTEVALIVQVREGPQILVSQVLVVGNEKVSLETIMREVTLTVGQPYSHAARLETQRALYELGGFRSVRVELEGWLPGETAARIVIAVEERATKTYEIGGGVEAGSYPRTLPEGGIEDRVIFAPRASFGFSRTNIGGYNRTFTAFARFSLKPTTNDQDGFGSPDYRVIGTYRERYAFGLKSDLLLSAVAEQGLRSSYNFIKRATSAEFLRPLTPRVTASGRYTLEWSRRFDEVIPPEEQLIVDRLYPQVRISMFSGAIAWDRRDDPLQTTRGGMLAFNTDVALKAVGSEVSFIKTFGEATWFRPLIGPRRLIFGARANVGLARGYDPNLDLENALDDPLRDLPASQRFFSGGSATHRAYQLDRLGADDVMTPDGLSKGGNGLVLFNGELRLLAGNLLKRELHVVGFVDVGNVYHRVSTIDLSTLRTGYGFGIRYDSWIGPLRLDFGFKTDRRVFTGGPERRWEFHLSIGEVF